MGLKVFVGRKEGTNSSRGIRTYGKTYLKTWESIICPFDIMIFLHVLFLKLNRLRQYRRQIGEESRWLQEAVYSTMIDIESHTSTKLLGIKCLLMLFSHLTKFRPRKTKKNCLQCDSTTKRVQESSELQQPRKSAFKVTQND